MKIKLIVGIIVIAGLAFWGGMAYGQSTTSATTRTGQFAGTGGTRGTRAGGTGAAAGFTSGTILSKSATSMTIQLRAGGSQNILLSSSTQIMKTTAGTVNDLAAGAQVTVTGGTNSDNSITAAMVQIRPAGSPIPGAGVTGGTGATPTTGTSGN